MLPVRGPLHLPFVGVQRAGRSISGRLCFLILSYWITSQIYGVPAQSCIEQRPPREGSGSYILAVEGLDVHGGDFQTGVSWLFSTRALLHFVDIG